MSTYKRKVGYTVIYEHPYMEYYAAVIKNEDLCIHVE